MHSAGCHCRQSVSSHNMEDRLLRCTLRGSSCPSTTSQWQCCQVTAMCTPLDHCCHTGCS